MRFVLRFIATLFLGSFLLTPAFAEDAAKASSASTTLEAPAPNDSAISTGYLAPVVPWYEPQATAKTKTKSSSSDTETHPAVDLFAGYSYVRFNTDTLGTKEHFNWQGFNANIAGNVNRWFSLVGDFAVYRIKDMPALGSGSAYTFLFGPRFSMRRHHFTPFMHALFGAARLSDIQVPPAPNGSAFFNRNFSENAFATALGGGLDANF